MTKAQYTIRLDEQYLEKAKIIANKEVRSLNNLLEYFIAKGIEQYEDDKGVISFEE